MKSAKNGRIEEMKSLLKKRTLWILILGLIVPLFGEAKSLPNRGQHLRSDLKKCQTEVKRLSNLGYPEKAESQLGKCEKIKGQLARIEKGQMKVQRKLASLDGKKKSKPKAKPKKKAKKHKKRKHSEFDQ